MVHIECVCVYLSSLVTLAQLLGTLCGGHRGPGCATGELVWEHAPRNASASSLPVACHPLRVPL